MTPEQKRDALRELRTLADLLLHDSVDGLILIATHAANETSTTIAIAPIGKRGVDRLMIALEGIAFRMKVVCFLGPKGGPVTKLGGEPDMENPQ